MKEVKPGKYQHFKGGMYEVLGIVHHSEKLEELVLYKQLYVSDFPHGALWVRPLKMFLEDVEVEGKKVPRFKYLEADLDSGDQQPLDRKPG